MGVNRSFLCSKTVITNASSRTHYQCVRQNRPSHCAYVKRSLRSKEAALILLPVLGIGGFAWFQKRAEKVKTPPPAPSGILVASGMAIRPASKQSQQAGLSHEITVKIRCSGVHPNLWGTWHKVVSIDPLRSVSQQKMPVGFKPQENLAYGAVLTTTSIQKGKPVVKNQWRDSNAGLGGISMINNELVVSHQVPLKKVPASAGEVTFQGLYLVPGGKPVRVKCVVRPAMTYPLPRSTRKPKPSSKKRISL